jgi:hypothetical protein
VIRDRRETLRIEVARILRFEVTLCLLEIEASPLTGVNSHPRPHHDESAVRPQFDQDSHNPVEKYGAFYWSGFLGGLECPAFTKTNGFPVLPTRGDSRNSSNRFTKYPGRRRFVFADESAVRFFPAGVLLF